jgi:hypothetical protein
MSLPANTMDEVLQELDEIIAKSIAKNNFLGIFAYVYRRTTARIKQAIDEKQFEDNARMEILDVTFANLYLEAFHRFSGNLKTSASWETAFRAGEDKITIIQHLMLGMNAHINMDLAVAAASVAPGNKIYALKNDFFTVNLILNSLVNELQDRIAKVSRLMFLLDWAGKNTDELIINFSMAKARGQAWNLATALARMQEPEKSLAIAGVDNTISNLGELILRPRGYILHSTLNLIAFFEEKNVASIIKKLRES